ncbi:MAG: hypothetical protein AB1650_08775 [Candidatus Omnitrophota bacterium]
MKAIRRPVSSCSILLVMLLNLSGFVSPVRAQSVAETTVAVISTGEPSIYQELILSSLESQISGEPGLVLVEREQINKILAELELSTQMGEEQRALQLGQLISADVFLFLSLVPDTNPAIDRIRFVEAKTGTVLDTIIEGEHTLVQDLSPIISVLKNSLIKLRVPIEQRHYVSVVGMDSMEFDADLDGQAEALRMFLELDLAKNENIMVVDRDHLQYLERERILTNKELKLVNSSYTIAGSLRYLPGKEEIEILLRFRNLDEVQQKSYFEITQKIPVKNLDEARQLLAAAILEQLDIPVQDRQSSSKEEADLYARRVPLYLASGDEEKAVRYAEVAYALLKNQNTRYLAARAWQAWGWKIANLVQKKETDPRRRDRETSVGDPAKQSRTSNVSFLRKTGTNNSTESAKVYPSPSNPPAHPAGFSPTQRNNDAFLPSQKQSQCLSALIRAVNLLEEYTREHIENFETGRETSALIPDPDNIFPASLKLDSSLTKLSLRDRISDDPEKTRLFEILVSGQNKVIDQVQKYYLRHYDSSSDVQVAYWDTWRMKKEALNNFYGYNEALTIPLIEAVVCAFHEIPSGDQDARIKALLEILGINTKYHIIPEEKSLFEKLAGDTDPLIRMMAHRLLMRLDQSTQHVKEIVKIMIKDLPYNHPYRKLRDTTLLPNYFTPVFYRMAIFDAENLLILAPKILYPILENNDMPQLVAFHDIFWPYINGLLMMNQNKEASELIKRAVDILEQGNYLSHSNEARKFRSELDLILVTLKEKDQIDQNLKPYFKYTSLPFNVRLRPEIEAPRLEGPIDKARLKKVPFPESGTITNSISNTSEVVRENSAGVKLARVIIQKLDAEGHETFTFQDIDANEEKNKSIGTLWEEYESRQMRIMALLPRDADTFRPSGRLFASPQVTIEGDRMFVLYEKQGPEGLAIEAGEYNLLDGMRFSLGLSPVVKIDHGETFITSMAIGPDAVYAGTQKGLIIFPRTEARAFQNNSSQIQAAKELSSLAPDTAKLSRPENCNVEFLTTKEGLPANNILSLVYDRDKLYMGIGPTGDGQTELTGVSGLALYDLKTGTYQVFASSRDEEKKNGLSLGDAYQITSLLVDHSRECLWLGVGWNPKLNGIWRYDLKTNELTQSVKERLSVDFMQWDGGKLVYGMYQSGLTRYDPEANKKEWLMGYTVSSWTGEKQPLPPEGYEGEPLYGYPQTRLWPLALDGDRVMTLSWDKNNILLHRPGEEPVSKGIFAENVAYIGQKYYLASNEHGIWLVTVYGEVYLITRK